jgi:peptidoglycan/xylan/chitin deacetylase (PgdA/CDA1 family)
VRPVVRRVRPLLRRARPIIRRAGDLPGGTTVARLLERRLDDRPHRLPVLTYHRIAEVPRRAYVPDLISATPTDFAKQVRALARVYRFLSLEELLEIRRGEASPRSRSALITFDEGYVDFAEHAWPVLRRHGIPATLFVATAFPDTGTAFWWDEIHHAMAVTARRDAIETDAGSFRIDTPQHRAHTLRRVHDLTRVIPHVESTALIRMIVSSLDAPPLSGDVLGWDQLRALAADGVTVAPHTRTHPRLSRLPRSTVLEELRGSQEDIRRELGHAPPVLAYPVGDIDDAVADAAAEAGFEIAFTTRRGVNDLRRPDWLRLDRINVGRAAAVPMIRAQLAALPRSGTD